MILNRRSAAKQWSPRGFEQFASRYPATDWSPPALTQDRTGVFLERWYRGDDSDLPSDIGIVLTAGLFSEWLPQCFRGAKKGFEASHRRVLKTSVRTGCSVRDQASRLRTQILAWLGPTGRFVWCTHSKGGLDALWALEEDPELRRRCLAAVLVQVPVGRSHVVEKWLSEPVSVYERAMAGLLRRRWFQGGVAEISANRDPLVSRWLESFEPRIPAVHVISWSEHATSWVDSYHRQLNALRPGQAHDGQFYLADQQLPSTPVVCLPRLDHAQPVLGGQQLDVARLWQTLVVVAWAEASLQTR